MDEALARVSIDLSGRPALVFHAALPEGGKIGSFDVQLVREFFHALVNNGKFNCHIEAPAGTNHHHVAEAIFKAFGRALRQAVAVTGTDIPSTKGTL
jgi:imidazoleglycerol-phosphate dehydratase